MMTLLKWILLAVSALAVVLIIAGQLGALRGNRPNGLGVKDGRLKAPSPTTNSVSSQTALHAEHAMRDFAAIAPLPLHGDAAASIKALRALVEAQPGAAVIEQSGDYLYAEFRTRVLGFVDDVEFWAEPAAGVIHLRSSSRIGRKDFGVNRQRIETLRAQWAGAAAAVAAPQALR